MDPLMEDEFQNTKKSRTRKIFIILSLVLIVVIVVLLIILIANNSGEKGDKKKEEDNNSTEPYVISPKSGNYTHVLFFAHGINGTPEVYLPFIERLNFKLKNQTKIILFRAPKRYIDFMGNETTAWFDFYGDNETSFIKPEPKSIEQATQSFKTYIDEEAKILGNKYERIILGGHSLGAMMTFHTGLSIDKKLGGLLVLSGYLFPETPIYDEERKNINMLVTHGENDTIINVDIQRKSVERIKDFTNTVFSYYDGLGHNFNKEEIDEIVNFIDNVQNSTI